MSSYRSNTLKAMEDDIKIPTVIARDAGIRVNHISNVLRDLKELGVCECLNENSRKGRLYRLTEEGEEIVKLL